MNRLTDLVLQSDDSLLQPCDLRVESVHLFVFLCELAVESLHRAFVVGDLQIHHRALVGLLERETKHKTKYLERSSGWPPGERDKTQKLNILNGALVGILERETKHKN